MEQSLLSKRRERKRGSSEVIDFRNKILDFFERLEVEEGIRYCVMRDLSTKTDMEFYGQKRARICVERNRKEVVARNIELLIQNGDIDFSRSFIKKISVQQN